MAFRPDTKYYIGSKEYDTIYEAFDALAFNFIKKPIDNQRFQAIIEKAICFIEANKVLLYSK